MPVIYGEIKDQYRALEQTRALLDTRMEELKAFWNRSGPGRVVYVGCGSSYSVAKSLSTMTGTLLGLPSLALAGGDLLIHAETYAPLLEGAILVAISRSGSTSEVIKAAAALWERGVKFRLLGVSCVVDAPLSARADLALELPWAFDESVCQTRTVTALYYLGAYLLASLAGRDDLLADLRETVAHGPAFLEEWEKTVRSVAQRDWSCGVVLADAELEGIAEEGALAFKEICQLPSNYYHVLDSRHGPMVLIREGTVVVVAMSDPACALERDLIGDLRKKGAELVVYSDTDAGLEGVTNITFGRPLSHIARGVPLILICQLLTYHKSFVTGTDPGSPAGLDAWIKL